MLAKQFIAQKWGNRQLAVRCNTLVNKLLCLICLTATLALTSLSVKAQFSGGDGSEASPFRITTPEQLALMHNYADGYYSFILANNLDLKKFDAGDGHGWLPVGDEAGRPFTGKFNGNGKIISNLIINRPDMIQVGLFGYLWQGAVVANLTLDNVNVMGKEDVGALVGLMAHSSVVDNCHARSGIVVGGVSVGGLVGYVRTGSLVKNSSANAILRGYADYTGGLVGEIYAASVENSTSKGTVYSATSSTGGLVGFMHSAASVRNSYSASRVVDIIDTIRHHDSRYTGGLVGMAYTRSLVENCYASGVVRGTESVGGLIGWADMDVHSRNNVALNTSVTGNSDVCATQGRMERSEVEQQYTRGDMVIKEQGVTMQNPSSLEAGINISFDETKTPFYQNIGWKFGVDERNPWVFDEAENMPMLWFERTPVTSLSLNTNIITLYPDDVYELLAATVEPSNAHMKLVQWQSANPAVATVSAEGVVKAISLGTTNVLVRTVDGGHEALCRINVIPRTTLAVEKNEVSVNVYPNPVRDVLTVEASEEIVSVTVYSAAGVLLFEKRDIGNSSASISVSHLPSGVNVLVVRLRSGMRSLKFVVF